ncbi:MAG: MBL fold metallo-hydrolase [Candidatus Omnitrophota bacterium]|jgi:glyoxylase-like metal-dependent hydrolase (beta-lactamase superfamily II)|nr:MAG: MBL fold metallo-hydrolase [Candidatus Omnitrophota bacterium]
MIIERVTVGPVQTNCYILALGRDREAILIDPGDEERRIKKALRDYGLTPCCVINTHGHFDHIGCDDKFSVPVYIHSEDARMLKDAGSNFSNLFSNPVSVTGVEIKLVQDKDLISHAGMVLEVLHTPGHSPGGIALLLKKPDKKVLFTGDTLFFHGVGRTDFPGSDESLLFKSIREKLFSLSDDVTIYPGHGPSSTIGVEKKSIAV